MAGTSKKTTLITFRVPVDVARKVRVNAAARDITVSSYLGKIVTTQVMRKR